jgi:hypothetical protein
MTMIYIIWMDACADSGDWLSADDIETELMPIHSIGYLVKQTDTCVTIAQSLDHEGKSGERLTIPNECIQDLYYLVTKPSDE